MSQKKQIFIATAVRISNPTRSEEILNDLIMDLLKENFIHLEILGLNMSAEWKIPETILTYCPTVWQPLGHPLKRLQNEVKADIETGQPNFVTGRR
jgi:hypothetical protein